MRPSRKASFVVVLIFLSPTILHGQSQSPDAVWTRLGPPSVGILDFEPAQGSSAPSSTFGLSQERIGAILRSAPHEFTAQAENNPTIVTIPFPDGRFERFRVEVAPVIEKPLESRGFETLTYKGVGIDDPSATVRFEQAFDGFHAMVRSSRGVFFIDPTKKGNRGPYVSYFASSRPSPVRKVHCEVSSEQAKKQRRPSDRNKPASRPAASGVAFTPSELRGYRLAIAVNSYYVAAVYDNTLAAAPFDQAAAAVTRTVNRINGIYESELGIHLTLVPTEAKIIYVDPKTDPYRNVNKNASAALPLNQSNLDNVIGSKNYDIGHLFTTGTAGLAMLRSVCNGTSKAQGVTGISTPTGDDFDVDFVSHEIGHQFGANHTFNAITNFCNGNRNGDTAYEPGSGSTIMGYAGNGICDPESLQDHSDPYFHLASLLEIEDFVGDSSPGGGGSCGASTPVSFAPPSVSASGSYTIPKATPFVLTAELSNTPPNPTVFNWEEFDLGDPAPPDDESGPPSVPRPLFRSKRPDGRTYRFFPDFENLIETSGTSTLGEAFPMLDRTMKFRVVGRNNHGSFTYIEVPVKIDATSGPFKITSVSGGNSWPRGSAHTIRWDTARTERAPVNCALVHLFLAVDGNPSNLYPLAKGISNSGSYSVTIPADAPLTDRAFLILKSDKNIFFAVYPFALQVTAP
jgi:reprolysin-like metallo-peptidase family M12B/Ser-Thr-rich glycosyl-phosphatidyl-inositol-anchored membrane family protein